MYPSRASGRRRRRVIPAARVHDEVDVVEVAEAGGEGAFLTGGLGGSDLREVRVGEHAAVALEEGRWQR